MNEHKDMEELFRLAFDAYRDRCLTKKQLYEIIEKHGLFKGMELWNRSGQTRMGILLQEYKDRTLGKITLTILRRSKNNTWFSFNATEAGTPSVSIATQETKVSEPASTENATSEAVTGSVPPALNEDWTGAFLASYKETGNITWSCQAARISRPTFYLRKEKDPAFKEALQNAYEDAIDNLVEAARKRAVDKSDVLTIFLLKSMHPDRFGDRSEVKHSGQVQQNHVHLTTQEIRAIEQARAEYNKANGITNSQPLTLEANIISEIEKVRKEFEEGK